MLRRLSNPSRVHKEIPIRRQLSWLRVFAVATCLCFCVIPLAPALVGVAAACEGGGEEEEHKEEEKEKEKGVGFAYSPSELKWKSKETGAKKLEIKVIPGSDPVKLIKQKTTDETDFETKDPNKCFGKTFTAPCSVEISRKTTTVTGLKFWEFEFEDEIGHHVFNQPKAVDLEGQ
jgi:hypothetical protein